MLPSHLYSSYKLYKQYTDDVATWLAESARSLGYSSPTIIEEGKEPSSEPNDAKKRSKAKKKLHNSSKKSDQHIIPIREFLNLAIHITQKISEPLKIPLSILNKLQRTIDARKECNLWCQMNEGNKKSDDAHSHFLNILQQVLEILKPHSTSSNNQKVENIFSHLHIEEPSNKFQQAQTTEQTPKAEEQELGVKYTVETPQDKYEAFFAGFTLFNDIAQIYGALTELWKQYHQGTLDLITLSLTTNTAIDLVQRIEESFFEQFPSIEDPDEIIKMMYVVKAKTMGKELVHLTEFGEDMKEVVYFIHGDMLVILNSLMDVMSADSIPISKPGFFGTYKPKAKRDKMSVKARFDEDKLLLGELLPDFWMLAWNKERTLWEDGLTRGFRTMLYDRKLTISAMFAARLFLHVHHLLRLNVAAPFKQLQTLGNHIKKSWELTLRMRDPSQAANWPTQNDRGIYSNLFGVIHNFLEEDAIGLRIRKLVQNQRPVPPGDFRLFRQHPLMCGLLAFYLHSETHRAGILYANAMGAILYTSHLYNATQQEGSCGESWPDMEVMINMQSEERVFVGERPTTAEDYFKRFCLCMGMSAEQFAANRRPGGAILASRGPRTLDIKGELSTILYEHYRKNTTTYLEPLEEFVNSRFVVDEQEDGEEKSSAKQPGHVNIGVLTVALKQRTKDEARAYLKRKSQTQTSLSPVEMLLGMKSIIAEEIPMLAFDYFHLHRSCWMVLDMTQKVLHERFLKYFESGYLESKAQLPFIVGYVFIVASESHQLAGRLGLRRPRAGAEVSSELLNAAGQTLHMLLTDQSFGPEFVGAALYAGSDGKMMFSSTGESMRIKPGMNLDLGAFELVYRPR